MTATSGITRAPKDPVILARRRELRGPSAPWIAIAAVVMVLASFGWWLLYMWNVIDAMNTLGAWNYLISLALVFGAAVLMRFWRGA
jgi:hypothetical protein